MRQSESEKLETIRLVEDSELSGTATVRERGIPRSTFYGWYRRYKERGASGLLDRHSGPGFCWNRIPKPVRDAGGQNRVEPSGSLSAGTGLADHQHPGLLHLRIQRLPDSEAVRPDHQSSLHRDVGQRSLPASNPACERTLADQFYLFQGRRLGMVLPVHGPR